MPHENGVFTPLLILTGSGDPWPRSATWKSAHWLSKFAIHMTQPIVILVTDFAGKNRAVRIHLEEEAVAFLASTHATEAPISFRYQDGSAVETEVIERILKQLFSRMAAEETETTRGFEFEHRMTLEAK